MKVLKILLLLLSFIITLNANNNLEEKNENLTIEQIAMLFGEDEVKNQERYKDLVSWLERVTSNVKNSTQEDYSTLIENIKNKKLYKINDNIFSTEKNNLRINESDGKYNNIEFLKSNLIIIKGHCKFNSITNSIVICTGAIKNISSQGNIYIGKERIYISDDGFRKKTRGSIYYSEKDKVKIELPYLATIIKASSFKYNYNLPKDRFKVNCLTKEQFNGCTQIIDNQNYEFKNTYEEDLKVKDEKKDSITKNIFPLVFDDIKEKEINSDILNWLNNSFNQIKHTTNIDYSKILNPIKNKKLFKINNNIYSTEENLQFSKNGE